MGGLEAGTLTTKPPHLLIGYLCYRFTRVPYKFILIILWRLGSRWTHYRLIDVVSPTNKVHEGPIRVAMSGSQAKLKPGMFFSDEPGYYQEHTRQYHSRPLQPTFYRSFTWLVFLSIIWFFDIQGTVSRDFPPHKDSTWACNFRRG